MNMVLSSERKTDSGVMLIGPAVTWREPGLIGMWIVMALAGATLLLLRAYLPRWIFGTGTTINWVVPVSVFVSYACLGIVAFVAMAVVDHWLSRHDWHGRYGQCSLRQRLVIGSLLIGMVNGLVVTLVIGPIAGHVLHIKLALFNMWLLSITLGIAVYISLVLNRAAAAQREQAMQVQLEADQLDTALSQAELSMIQAQIEPHFLFNTLAHIKRQYRLEPTAADHMITGLIEYLERAAPAVQRADWTIGDELDLIRVYLDILAHRFGERLRYTITAPDNLCTQRLPALTITTLVENAVRHGIAPRPEGGTVAVTVESGANSIAIHVHDNGVGLRQMSGSGLGLATVKASLRSRFGGRASLVVEPNEPHGVHAAIEILREQ